MDAGTYRLTHATQTLEEVGETIYVELELVALDPNGKPRWGTTHSGIFSAEVVDGYAERVISLWRDTATLPPGFGPWEAYP